jgi:hypothetical protein
MQINLKFFVILNYFKMHILYEGKSIRIMADFLKDTIKARRA